MLFRILLYTMDNITNSYILKCTLPVTTSNDAIDIIKRPYSYMARATTKEYIARLVLQDFNGDIILAIDTEQRIYYNNIDGTKHKTLYDYSKTLIKNLLRCNYREDNNIEW